MVARRRHWSAEFQIQHWRKTYKRRSRVSKFNAENFVWQNIKVPSNVIANDAEAIEQILTRITERKPHLASFIKVTRDQKNQITECIFLTGQNVLDEEYAARSFITSNQSRHSSRACG
jgi:hypothetical protein